MVVVIHGCPLRDLFASKQRHERSALDVAGHFGPGDFQKGLCLVEVGDLQTLDPLDSFRRRPWPTTDLRNDHLSNHRQSGLPVASLAGPASVVTNKGKRKALSRKLL